MTSVKGLPEYPSSHVTGGSDFRKIRFRAPNGATVTISVGTAPGSRERALALAKEAVSQLAEEQREELYGRTGHSNQKVDCAETFWSWALPEGWHR